MPTDVSIIGDIKEIQLQLFEPDHATAPLLQVYSTEAADILQWFGEDA